MFVLACWCAMQQSLVWVDFYREFPLKATTLEEAITEAQQRWPELKEKWGTYRVEPDGKDIFYLKRPRLRRVEDFKDVKFD